MAEMILPVMALAGFVRAAPQGVGFGGSATAGVNAGAGAEATVSTSAPPSTAVTSLAVTTSAAQVSVSTPISNGNIASAALTSLSLPNVALPSVPSISAGGAIESLTGSLAAGLATGLPSAPGLPATSLPGAPGLPSTTLPDVPTSALNNIPAILQTSFPTGSILPVDITTLVPVTNTDVLQSLATLPVNADITGVLSSILGGVPTATLPALSTSVSVVVPTAAISGSVSLSVPTAAISATAPQLAPAPEVQAIIDQLSGGLLANVADTIASALAQVAAAAGSSLPTPDVQLPSQVLSALQAIPTASLTAGVYNVLPLACATGLPTGVVTPSLPAVSASGTATPSILPLRTQEDADEDVTKEKRFADNLLKGNSLAGRVANAISGPANGATLADSINSVIGYNQLSTMSGAWSASPLGSLLNNGPIQSIIVGTTRNIPIVAPLSDLSSGVETAATLPLMDALSELPVLSSLVRTALATLNTFGIYNVGSFGELAKLTNIAALQTAIQFIDIKDLALTTYILAGTDLFWDNTFGSLLQNPTELIKAISAAQPLADNLPAVASYLVLSQLGATNLQNIVPDLDTSVISGLLTKLPNGTLALPNKQ